MIKLVSTSTETYSETVTDNVEIKISKVINAQNTCIYGKVLKDGNEIGYVSYDRNGNYVTTQLKPFSGLTEAELVAFHSKLPACIIELVKETQA